MCNYDYRNPGFTAGHFTQMVWAGTQRVGCAMVGPGTCPNGITDREAGRTYQRVYMLVCEYDSPGTSVGCGPGVAQVCEVRLSGVTTQV